MMQVCFLLVLMMLELHMTEGCFPTETETINDISAYAGGSVLLPCSCTDLQTKPGTFKWERLLNNQWEKVYPCDPCEGRLQLVNGGSPGNLSLLISDLSKDKDKYYRCTVNRHYRDFKLTVEDEPSRSSTPRTSSSPNSDPSPNTSPAAPSATETAVNTMTVIIIFAAAAGVLLLILGGVGYWKYRVRRRSADDKQTEQTSQQSKQNESAVLYAVINPQTKRNKAEDKNDVMYSTVVHSNTVRAADTPATSGDTAVYASIKSD